MNLPNRFITCLSLSFLSVTAGSQVVSVFPFSPLANTETAIRALSRQLPSEAHHALEQLSQKIGARDLHDRAHYALCQSDMEAGNIELADICLENFISERLNSPFISLAHFARGEIAFRRLDFEKANVFFEQSSKVAQTEVMRRGDSAYSDIQHMAEFWSASSLALSGRYEEAFPVYIAAAKDTKSVVADDALFALGQIEETRGNYLKAIAYYRQIAESHPNRNTIVASKVRHAQCLLFLREFSNAITELESASNIVSIIKENDNPPGPYEKQSLFSSVTAEIHYLRGEALNQLRQFNQSMNEFKEVLSDSTATTELRNQSHLGIGWAYLNLHRPADALLVYDTFLASNNEVSESRSHALAKLYRCVALIDNGSRDEAVKELLTLSSASGYAYVAQALLELGQIYYEDSKFENARRTLERAENESADVVTSVRINLLLGAVYLELQTWKLAVKSYHNAETTARKTAVHVLPQKDQYIAEALLKRGIACTQDYHYREAITDLNSFIAGNPDDDRNDEALFWLAEAFYRADLMRNAEDTYLKILNIYGTSKRREESLYGLGWTYFRTRNFEKSNETFSKMLSEFPSTQFTVDALIRKGDGLYLTKKYIEAAKAYKEAYKISPKEEQGQYAQFQIGQSLYRTGDYANASVQLRQFVKNFPKSVFADHSIYTLAWIATLQERHNDAITLFESLVAGYPQSELVPASLYYIANAFYNKEDYETAIIRYKVLIETYKSDYYAFEAVKGLQDALTQLGRTDEAIAVGKSLAESNPEGTLPEQITMKTIELFLKRGDYSSSAKEYQDFLKKYPDSEYGAEAMYLLAKSQLGLNDPAAAEQSFATLFAKYPKSDYAARGLLESGLMRQGQSDVSKADSLFALVFERFPGSDLAARAGYERAQMKMSRGDTIMAITILNLTGETTKGEYKYQSLYKLGMYYRSKSMNDSARSYFAKVSLDEENTSMAAEAEYRIGELYMEEKNYLKASEAFERVKAKFDGIEDWYTLSLINLGECYEKIDNTAKAKEIYQTVIILHPDDDYGKSAQARLKRLGK